MYLLIGVDVSCRISYSVVSYLYVSFSGLIIEVGEEKANFSAIIYLKSCSFCSEGFPLSLGAWDRLHYFIVALPGPSILLFYNSQLGVNSQSFH